MYTKYVHISAYRQIIIPIYCYSIRNSIIALFVNIWLPKPRKLMYGVSFSSECVRERRDESTKGEDNIDIKNKKEREEIASHC